MSYRKLDHYEVEVVTNEPCIYPNVSTEVYICDKTPVINNGYFIIYANDGNKYITCNIVKRVNCKDIWIEVN